MDVYVCWDDGVGGMMSKPIFLVMLWDDGMGVKGTKPIS
jgi:hypothetical protein